MNSDDALQESNEVRDTFARRKRITASYVCIMRESVPVNACVRVRECVTHLSTQRTFSTRDRSVRIEARIFFESSVQIRKSPRDKSEERLLNTGIACGGIKVSAASGISGHRYRKVRVIGCCSWGRELSLNLYRREIRV